MFHNSLEQVIVVQLLLMLALLLAVSVPFWQEISAPADESAMPAATAAFLKVREVTENEVIAEFLRAEFYQPEFDPYREEVANIVFDADLGNDHETNEEIWFTNSDARTHCLYLGTTGSGKTFGLKSYACNALCWASGFVYIDGKARYLGPHGSSESKEAYRRIVAEIEIAMRLVPPFIVEC